jgi:hypothetical protein
VTVESNRQRVWVPGVLFVTDDGELVAGSHAGFSDRGKAFAKGKRAHPDRLTELRHRMWLVERAALTPELIAEHALILPETLLDPDQQPNARRWLASQPLLCVSGGKLSRLVDDGLRVYTVAYGVADDRLEVAAEGGERAAWSFSARLEELWPKELRPAGDVVERMHQSGLLEVRSFVDRVLAQLSRGALREASVIHAFTANAIVEPGYGYRGATDGVAATVEEVARELQGLEALFAQVYIRSKPARGAAKEIARAVERAPADARKLTELPIYDSARRELLGELVIPLGGDAELTRAGTTERELVLPEETRWFVDRVDPWEPVLPPEIAAVLEQVRPAAKTPSPWVAVVLMGVLAVIVAMGYVLG